VDSVASRPAAGKSMRRQKYAADKKIKKKQIWTRTRGSLEQRNGRVLSLAHRVGLSLSFPLRYLT
jgi:hypothetical protein